MGNKNKRNNPPPGQGQQPSPNPPPRIVRQQVTQQVEFSGPIPPPAAFEHYERVAPGAANRILAMAEVEMAHRHGLETRALDAETREARLGQYLGFSIGVIAIVAGTVAAIMGAEWPGGFIGTAGVVGLVSVFVYGRKSQPKR